MTLRIISGKFKGRVLKTPKTNSTRPTQGMLREAVFNMCQNEIEGAKFLDLYAGSGAIGFEALSRGASFATLVEQNKMAAKIIKENIQLLSLENQTYLLITTAQKALLQLKKEGQTFDIIYIDPPYDTPLELDLLTPLLSSNTTIFIEERFDPKKPHTPPSASSLQVVDTRRFGIALLTTLQPKGLT